MPKLVESLKRLYTKGKVAVVKLQEMKQEGKLTQEEFDYITALSE